MADLTVKSCDPRGLQHADFSPSPASAPPKPAAAQSAKGQAAARDTGERWKPSTVRCAPTPTTRPPRSPEALLAALKRSASSVMVERAPRDAGTLHGAETVGAHGVLEGAAHVLELFGRHAAGKALSVASPVITFVEAGVHVLEQNQRAAISSQRRAAAQGFANSLAAALDRQTRCLDAARTDPWVLERGGLSASQRERDFYTWGATAGAKFAATLSPQERESLVKTIGTLAAAGRPTHDNKFELSVRVQRHVLGTEWSQP